MKLRRLALPLVVLLALGAHAASVGNQFAFDDPYAIALNPSVNGPLSLGRLLHCDFWGRARDAADSVGTWRPLPTLTFWIDWHLGGGRSWPFHAVNVLWHALAALALALALGRASGDRRLGCVAAGLWALFGANGEAVASAVGRADMMATAFGFLAWWFWRRQLALAALAYFAACLCKESAIILPIWLFAVEWLLAPPNERRPAWRWALLVATGLGYALLRSTQYQPFSHIQLAHYNNPLLNAGWGLRLWTGLRLLLLTLRVILVPLNLSSDYSGWELDPGHGLSWESAAGALALLLLAAGVVGLRRRQPVIAAGLALFLITWSVISNVVVLLPTIFAERLLYLPSAGIAMILGWLATKALAQPQALGLAFWALVGAANLAASVSADRMWHDELRLYRATVEVSPRCARAWYNYGVSLSEDGQLAAAAAAFHQSLKVGASADAATNLGITLNRLGQAQLAEYYLNAATKLDPDNRSTVRNAAIFWGTHRDYREMIDLLEAYLQRHPEDAELSGMLRHAQAMSSATAH